MLTKFEAKSNRVKGLAFHPKRPWLLASLHNGAVQIWDYRMGTMVDQYEEHEGPVRGCAFHPTQPLFVTGGDDNKVKVFNYRQRKCLFTLTGHLDYVRSVSFHHEAPWILSTSDDQTIRIWNWQNRSCVAVLTGHNHYVMCAQFHPKDELVVSASLDQTIRVWDVASIFRKHAAPSSSSSSGMAARMDDAPSRAGQIDLFGTGNEGTVKFILEGHDRGVNWVQFHPSKPLIVSGSDDRSVKLWRYNDTRAWETDTFRGHFNNVSCVLFHPRLDVILSNSEDKTIRVWDYSKRSNNVQSFRREADRFWSLVAHPELNLFAAGHDNGLVVFKLERERLPYCLHEDTLYYVKERELRAYKLDNFSGAEVSTLATLEKKPILPAGMTFNAAENSVLISSNAGESANYELYSLRSDSRSDPKRGAGSFGIFIARNRFAILDVAEQQIHIKSLDNSTYRSFACPIKVRRILPCVAGSLLLASHSEVSWYDLQQNKITGTISAADVKYAIWSSDMSRVALLSKKTINFANRANFALEHCVTETVAVKSGVWDAHGLFFYTNAHHLKYCLPRGDTGIICTINQPLYLVRVKGDTAHALDRDGAVLQIALDPTEFVFKLALQERDYAKVMSIVNNSSLMGQSIIAYLRQNGYAEIALQFVKDPMSRFDLALECSNMDIALEAANKMDQTESWRKLGEEAQRQGNIAIAEIAFKRINDYNKLSFLYLITGNLAKLQQLTLEGEHVPLPTRVQNGLWLGDVAGLTHAFADCNQNALAYALNKATGNEQVARRFLQHSGEQPAMNASLVAANGNSLSPPEPLFVTEDSWPLTRPVSLLALPVTTPEVGKKSPSMPKSNNATTSFGESLKDSQDFGNFNDKSAQPISFMDDDGGDGGWDIDDSDLKFDTNVVSSAHDYPEATSAFSEEASLDANTDPTSMPAHGQPASDFYSLSSAVPFNHAAAGSIESALQLLFRQSGIVNFTRLEEVLMRVAKSGAVFWSNGINNDAGLATSSGLVCKSWQEDDVKKRQVRPIITPAMLQEELNAALQLTTMGKFSDAVNYFDKILLNSTMAVCEDANGQSEVVECINTCREYLVGLRMEQARKDLGTDFNNPGDAKRALELACFFTHCKLRNVHLILALRSAVTLAYKLQNYKTAGLLARRLLECGPNEQIATQARKVLSISSSSPEDAIPLDFDLLLPFSVCSGAWRALPRGGAPSAPCPFCGATFGAEYNNQLCKVCQLAQIGAAANGLQLHD